MECGSLAPAFSSQLTALSHTRLSLVAQNMKSAPASFILFFCLAAARETQAQMDPAPQRPDATLPSTNTDGSMVLIHGGTFQMGIDAADVPRFQRIFRIESSKLFQDELPRHTVTIKDFYMDKNLITNTEFKRFVDANQKLISLLTSEKFDNGNYLQHWKKPDDENSKPDHPVVNVNWHAASLYCRWAGKRLPTEAEWEFAARGGKDTLFPWGDEQPDETRANFAENVGTTTPVEAYPPNGFDLYDMAGNVWQFLSHDWTKYPDHAVTGTPQRVNQEALEVAAIHPNAVRKVIRGGSYAGAPVNLWLEYRDSHPANGSQPFVGFRCAKSAAQPTPSK